MVRVNRALPAKGVDWLHNPVFNKGTAFTDAERDLLGLRGLLPPHVQSMDEQVRRVMANFRSKASDLERYIQIVGLQDRNETLFYRVVMDNLEELMPIIYTPTVGKACQEYGHIFRRSRGFYVSINDRGRVEDILRNWPTREVKVIVVTDGERILGLGDLGASGMGIPVGKLSLYTACAGIHPTQCMPATIDVGTDNAALLADPLYIGLRQKRIRGAEYDAFVEEFMLAVDKLFPGVLVQFEDFGNQNAFRLLDRYRERACTFNDDIQGTGAVALAGVLSALRLTGGKLADHRILFLGAGEAGLGIAENIVNVLMGDGLSLAEARKRCWFVDSKGLIVKGREQLTEHKLHYAHDQAPCADLLSAIKAIKPSMLMGVSGQPKTFTREIISLMAEMNQRPVIFALSNPTSKAECTAEEAYLWTNGRAVFASGSPFAPVRLNDTTLVPGQGNNAYIFPGVGLGIICSGGRRVTDSMFIAAARTLAGLVRESELAEGRVYPSLSRIHEVSQAIAVAVAEEAFARNLNTHSRPEDLAAYVRSQMFRPEYPDYTLK
ncbi:MAG TPA: NAD-dependent malic enzyme [Candidatus Acidoferrales bacterium]|nr:NAD-dependent malic enzyme [Candidatus Acidoferrales bacterium]